MDNYTDLAIQIQEKLSKVTRKLNRYGHKDLINLINICATRLMNDDISLELLANSIECIAKEVEEREQEKQSLGNPAQGAKRYYIWKAEAEKPYRFLGLGTIPDDLISKFEPVEDGFYTNKVDPNNPEISEHFFLLPEDVSLSIERGVPKALAEKRERMVVCPKCKAIMKEKEPCSKCGAFLIEGPKPANTN